MIIKHQGELRTIEIPSPEKLFKQFIDNLWGGVTAKEDREAIMRIEIDQAIEDYEILQEWIERKVSEGKLTLDKFGKIENYG